MDERITRLSTYRVQIGRIPRITEGIEIDDLVLRGGQQASDKVGTDEPGAAGAKYIYAAKLRLLAPVQPTN